MRSNVARKRCYTNDTLLKKHMQMLPAATEANSANGISDFDYFAGFAF